MPSSRECAHRCALLMKHQAAASYVLVGVQFVCMGAILFSGPWFARHVVYFTLELSGSLLVLWAILAMRVTKVNVFPDVKAGSRLVTNGPYQWIRHPMYTALLMIMLALVCESFSYWRGFWWVLLAADLVAKLWYEEKLLGEVFDDYEAYRLRTWRLIPWIF